jgi:glycosyltransferase involved in cell wall biosynthesis
MSFMSKRITILYTELADYSLACFRALKECEVKLMLIHWPINPEAPFQFDLSFCKHVISRNERSDEDLVKSVRDFNPDLILCSGWMDKTYMNICEQHRNKVPVVLSMDNHWTGSLKQHLAILIAPFKLLNTFNRAFVPGNAQKDYALRLGFKEMHIQRGFYSAYTAKFQSVFETTHEQKKNNFPKRFLYLGRYVEHKGIFDLWDAFQKFRVTHPDWELWCVGTGDQFENRVEADGIRHFGFIQPSEMLPILQETGVYILPSHFEPWGVSVHEMAVAGFPMLLSDKIGSEEAFLKGNGREFQSGNVDSLLDAMQWIAQQDVSQLTQMAERSNALGLRNTPEIWAEKLLSFLK